MGRHFECRRRAKESRWASMSKIFPKLSRSITLAAKAGGPDPDSNATLRVAIQNAKAQNLSKENIENAIKRADGNDASNITEVIYEAKGPHGSLFFIECATDNTNRSVGNLKVILGKNGGEIAPSGSLNFMFDRKSVVEFPVPEGKDLEELEFELIDAGLEEMSVDDGVVTLIGDYTSFASLTSGVEAMGIEATKSGLQRLPTQPIDLTEEQMVDVENLLDKIEDDDDVQSVYTNLG
ncbi:MAG: YebC/PmpR family DNA-binding transcriptional regulator [Akkermansiaceae bacterium]|nr:YebC/PmpR family DNA-binding transcriptional regulator [Akkermansiaceae bacterium]MDP4721030.1 YebC/PmpR family DNA-binding transcriptional regulator [Akkermansiaceae bacterium]MDP4779377.1 YebC/PmpR family DNA-binding transcriptional regulator [Akkermansiaceae bacterium]MDP4848352.1 YebC/PmpR family DNA-binding transcriptional regulator [Akkermansiaceae bacterium]MDP4897658.1 YebC/PmpR family DNA-binding transcriptional regulator [Akkermansiaceae bacterium]